MNYSTALRVTITISLGLLKRGIIALPRPANNTITLPNSFRYTPLLYLGKNGFFHGINQIITKKSDKTDLVNTYKYQ